MAETLTLSEQEIHKQLENLSPEDDEKYWDIIYSEATRDAWMHPEVGTNTGPIPQVEGSEPLLEAGEQEPLLEAHSLVPELPAFEGAEQHEEELGADEQAVIERNLPEASVRAKAPHADEYHIEDEPEQPAASEAGETLTMDERFNTLLQSALDIIERRRQAIESGDRSTSIDDFASFHELYGQCEREGMNKDSLDLVAKLVTQSYELIDKEAATAAQADTERRPIIEHNEDLELALATIARPYVGDVVSLKTDDGEYSDGWLIVGDQFHTDTTLAPDQREVNHADGYHEYTIEKDGQRQSVRIEQLSLQKDSPAAERIVPALQELQERKNDVAAGSDTYEAVATDEAISNDDEVDGIDDVQADIVPVAAVETAVASVEAAASPAGLSFNERLDRYAKYVEENKQFWTENRKAAKEPHGNKFWRERWEKMKNPDRRRKLYLAGASALLAVGLGTGIAAVNQESSGANQNDDRTPVESADAVHSMRDVVKALDSEVTTTNETYPEGTFRVEAGDGPLDIVNRLGYSNDNWFKVADQMYEEFAVDKPHENSQDAILYKAGKDIRFDHRGNLSNHFREELISKLRALQ